MERETKATEFEIEVMESIALCGEVEEKDKNETFERCEKAIEVENKVDCGNQSLMSILKAKLLKMKRVCKDQLLKYGVIEKLDTIRVYQIWAGKNVFFFHGRLICGPDPRGLMLTTASIILSSSIFSIYVGKDVPHHSALVVMLCVVLTFIVLVILIFASTTDPGIIPRNDQGTSEEAGIKDGTKSKKVTVNGVEMKLKYCRVCRIFRPPRSCHCAICDNCVERYDHHCPWIGQCIGLRNHRFYIALVIFALIFYVYIFAFSCWRLNQRIWEDGDGFVGMVKICPETLALVAFGFIAIGFSGALAIYHVYLIAINETAYENYRQRYHGSKSPYDRGVVSNFKEAFFMVLSPPKVNFRAEVTSDIRTATTSRVAKCYKNMRVRSQQPTVSTISCIGSFRVAWEENEELTSPLVLTKNDKQDMCDPTLLIALSIVYQVGRERGLSFMRRHCKRGLILGVPSS
ncbi:hypothetical protein VNO77_28644 [Canavalia gladiata]|uniref:S-acyltransferase n=1 Tax=Canavalia gladiata TaxID=3824 RepID=A0AAN9Q7D1_CANGL